MQQYKDEAELHKHLVKDYHFRFSSSLQKEYHSAWGQKMIKHANLPKDCEVLDFGCGTGIFLKELTGRFERVAGVDISPDMLAVARQNFPDLDLKVAPGEDLPWPPAKFDAVFIKGSLHHLEDVPLGLKEIYRVLKPTGQLVLSEPCSDSAILRVIRFFWYRWSSKFSVHHKSFRSKELKDLLAQAGFAIEAEERFGFFAFPIVGMVDFMPVLRFFPGKRALMAIDNFLAKIPLIRKNSWHVILSARKQR